MWRSIRDLVKERGDLFVFIHLSEVFRPMVVWLRFRPVDRRVVGSIPESTNFLTNSSELTLWCPCSPSRLGVRHCEH